MGIALAVIILLAILVAIVLQLLILKRQSGKSLQTDLAQTLQGQALQTKQDIIEKLADNHINSLRTLHDGLQKGRQETNEQVRIALTETRKQITEQVEKLTGVTESRLKDISGQVDKRLNEGFEKTNQTFTDIVKRLALIDQAQQKISELSGNVVSLQALLNDKRSRGAFGEVQLTALIRNVLPEQHFELQAALSNGRRADCLLYLPQPTGHIVVDAKFPLENYHKLTDPHTGALDKKAAEQQFKRDIRKHIQDIAERYIIPGETADGAVMFIPAEAIFAEIHSHYPELVEAAHQAKVWLASPTTMMAILTTARAVLKDDATRHQVHIIQQHLRALGEDFGRFQDRMDGLQRHIEQANNDVRQVNISARKISGRFEKIEQVELAQDDEQPQVKPEPLTSVE